jgi:predicted alpha/beta superfamily hydrolase
MSVRSWHAYRPPSGPAASTVTGDLRVLRGLPGPAGGPGRDILVLLPVGALSSGRRYPVLYMHDGQNLFDAATSFAGEWEVDETLVRLAGEGIEPIVVGIPNAGEGRFTEYTPYRGRRGWANGGGARGYVRWLASTVKPAIDEAWPTRPGREDTGIMGSSLGGLVSLWAAVQEPGTFGLVGSMSTAIPPGQQTVIGRLGRLPTPPVRAYLDIGGHEGSGAPTPAIARRWSGAMLREARLVRDALAASGLREPASLRHVEDPDAIHHESAWARRLPDALRFLFGPDAPTRT